MGPGVGQALDAILDPHPHYGVCAEPEYCYGQGCHGQYGLQNVFVRVLTRGHFRGGLHCFRRSLVVAKDKQRLVRLCSCEQQIAAYYHRENQCQRKSYIDEKAPNDPEEEGKPSKPFGYPVEKSQIRIPNLKIARLPKVLLC